MLPSGATTGSPRDTNRDTASWVTTTARPLPGAGSGWEGSQSGQPPLAFLPEQRRSWASCLRRPRCMADRLPLPRDLRPVATGLPAVNNRPQTPNVSTVSPATTSPTRDPGRMLQTSRDGAEVGLQASSHQAPVLQPCSRLPPSGRQPAPGRRGSGLVWLLRRPRRWSWALRRRRPRGGCEASSSPARWAGGRRGWARRGYRGPGPWPARSAAARSPSCCRCTRRFRTATTPSTAPSSSSAAGSRRAVPACEVRPPQTPTCGLGSCGCPWLFELCDLTAIRLVADLVSP